LIGVLVCFTGDAHASNWTFAWASPSPQGNDLNAVDFVSPSSPIGWAVGKHGAAVRTTDGGATWMDRSAYAATQLYLWDVAAVSADIAVACELSGGIWRTVDGGITWDLVYQEPDHRDLSDLDRPAPGLIVAVGDRVLLRSKDDGASWTRIVHEDVEGALTDQLWFDATHGMFSCEFGIYSTDDGGVTMTPAAIDGPYMPFVCLDVRGDDGLAIATDGMNSFSFVSDDGGASWSLCPSSKRCHTYTTSCSWSREPHSPEATATSGRATTWGFPGRSATPTRIFTPPIAISTFARGGSSSNVEASANSRCLRTRA
jgi:photosystem II stability/assembly factor-like uncharacterized protein